MGSSQKRLAWLGAWTAGLVLVTALVGSAGAAGKSSRVPSASTGAATATATGTRGKSQRANRGHRPSKPKAPAVVLYDQYDNIGANSTSSQNFEASFDIYDSELADDFVVPSGQTWNINQVDAAGVYYNGAGPAASVNLRFYDNAGGLPGGNVATRTNLAMTDTGGSFVVPIPSPVVLGPGIYWVSVQANMDFSIGGQWGFTDRTVQSGAEAAWQNPGGGFGVCPSWGARGTVCGIDPGVPDQVSRLSGRPAAHRRHHRLLRLRLHLGPTTT